jgi:hypothetical protein
MSLKTGTEIKHKFIYIKTKLKDYLSKQNTQFPKKKERKGQVPEVIVL